MNTTTEKPVATMIALGSYYPYYVYVCSELQKDGNVHIQDILDEMVLNEVLSATQLESYVQQVRARAGVEMGYSKAQSLLFRALGYRTSGMAYDIRKKFSEVNRYTELHYPNLWHQFLHVPLQDSVFGSPDYCQDAPSLHYLEFLFEPLLRGLIPYEGNLPEPLKDTFLTMHAISQQKTMSLQMARNMAMQIEHELSGFVLRHTTALNLVAIALGYKVWAPLLEACKDESITNRRHVSKFAVPANKETDWTEVKSARSNTFGTEVSV